MTSSTANLQRQLEDNGYLSLNKFVAYLKEYHPEAYISYPTAAKLVKEGKLKGFAVGRSYRISRVEVMRWVSEGNLVKSGLNVKTDRGPNWEY